MSYFDNIPVEFYVFCSAVFGAALGSFYHVCVVRIPEERSIVSPPSSCPVCGEAIPWYNNIPILSYFFLGAACPYCKTPIPARYVIFEALTAAAFMGVTARFGFSTATLVYLLFVSDLLIISGIDWDHQYIPDELNIPMSFIALGLGALAQYTGAFPLLMVQTFWDALIGLAVGGGLIWSIRAIGTMVFQQEAMGFGDVKLMAFLGGFLGWQEALLCIFLAALTGSAAGLGLKLTGKLEKYGKIPFGPYLALGAYLCLMFGPEFLNWYLEPFRGM
ncbi:MAG: prepilin peptidase [bacterium]|nr:prepilin peptidase [bacterium]